MPDHSEISRIVQKMKEATANLHALAPKVGTAKMVREFSSDRRRRILAIQIDEAMRAGTKAVAAAEIIARASEAYGVALAEQEKQLEDAETVIAQFSAAQSTFEAARSILSMERENLKQLEG